MAQRQTPLAKLRSKGHQGNYDNRAHEPLVWQRQHASKALVLDGEESRLLSDSNNLGSSLKSDQSEGASQAFAFVAETFCPSVGRLTSKSARKTIRSRAAKSSAPRRIQTLVRLQAAKSVQDVQNARNARNARQLLTDPHSDCNILQGTMITRIWEECVKSPPLFHASLCALSLLKQNDRGMKLGPEYFLLKDGALRALRMSLGVTGDASLECAIAVMAGCDQIMGENVSSEKLHGTIHQPDALRPPWSQQKDVRPTVLIEAIRKAGVALTHDLRIQAQQHRIKRRMRQDIVSSLDASDAWTTRSDAHSSSSWQELAFDDHKGLDVFNTTKPDLARLIASTKVFLSALDPKQLDDGRRLREAGFVWTAWEPDRARHQDSRVEEEAICCLLQTTLHWGLACTNRFRHRGNLSYDIEYGMDWIDNRSQSMYFERLVDTEFEDLLIWHLISMLGTTPSSPDRMDLLRKVLEKREIKDWDTLEALIKEFCVPEGCDVFLKQAYDTTLVNRRRPTLLLQFQPPDITL